MSKLYGIPVIFQVYREICGKVRDAVISLVRTLLSAFRVGIKLFNDHFIDKFSEQIDQEREGEQIDRALLKNVLDIFVEIGLGNIESYESDFEITMLDATAAYYSRKASNWILEDSCPDYMLRVFLIFIFLHFALTIRC